METLLKNLEMLSISSDYEVKQGIGSNQAKDYQICKKDGSVMAMINENELGITYYTLDDGCEITEINMDELAELQHFVKLLRSE